MSAISYADETESIEMKSKTHTYLTIILVLSGLGVLAILVITALIPDKDSSMLIATILGFLTPSILAMVALMVKDTHDLTNSRMTELLDLTRKASRAEGKLEGVVETTSVAAITDVDEIKTVDLTKDTNVAIKGNVSLKPAGVANPKGKK